MAKKKKPRKALKKQTKPQIDVQAEVNQLKQQLLDTESRLTTEIQHSGQLQSQLEQKTQQIQALQKLLKHNTEKSKEESELVCLEAKTQQESAEHSASVLAEQVKQLQNEAEAHSIMEEENLQLRHRMAELLRSMETESVAYAEETHRLKKEAFNLRMQLEQTFRKTLQEMDDKYQSMAFEAMTKESKNALVANSRLKEELAMQSIGMESLLSRYKKQNAAHSSARMQKELMERQTKLLMAQMSGLKAEQRGAQSTIASLREKLTVSRARHAEADAAERKVQELTAQLEAAESRVSAAEEACDKWRSRAFAQSQQLLDSSQSHVLPGSKEALPEQSSASQRTHSPSPHALYSSSVHSGRGGSLTHEPFASTASGGGGGGGGGRDALWRSSHSHLQQQSRQFPQSVGFGEDDEERDSELQSYNDILSIWNSNFPAPVPAGAAQPPLLPMSGIAGDGSGVLPPPPGTLGAGMDAHMRAKLSQQQRRGGGLPGGSGGGGRSASAGVRKNGRRHHTLPSMGDSAGVPRPQTHHQRRSNNNSMPPAAQQSPRSTGARRRRQRLAKGSVSAAMLRTPAAAARHSTAASAAAAATADTLLNFTAGKRARSAAQIRRSPSPLVNSSSTAVYQQQPRQRRLPSSASQGGSSSGAAQQHIVPSYGRRGRSALGARGGGVPAAAAAAAAHRDRPSSSASLPPPSSAAATSTATTAPATRLSRHMPPPPPCSPTARAVRINRAPHPPATTNK